MSFESAVRVNPTTYGQGGDFDPREGRGRTVGQEAQEGGSRQRVDISEETLLRVARLKLGRLVEYRRGYDQRGLIEVEAPVGSLLSTKA